jgi:integrase
MPTLNQRGKAWIANWTDENGLRHRQSYGKVKSVAEIRFKDLEVKLAKQEAGIYVDDALIGDFIKKIDEYLRINVRTRTATRYREALDHFKRFTADKPNIKRISQINPALWEKYKAYRVPKAQHATINMELKIWRTFLNLAIRWGNLRENSIGKTEFLPVTENKNPRFYTREEAISIIDHTPAPYNDVFRFLLCTGLRRDELRFLDVENNIDLPRRRINIIEKEGFIPKTSERTIPISDDLLPFLKKRLKESPSGLIFPNHNGVVFDERKWWKILQKVLEKLEAKKIKIPHATIHAFRHTFASWLVMSGVDLRTVQRLLGHSDIRTTMRYSHLAEEHLDKAVNNINLPSAFGTVLAHSKKTKKKPS